MKKILLASSIATLFMASAAQAESTNVAGGQVNFYGSVTDVSCTVSVDGQGSDASVYVAPIAKNEIKADSLLKAKSFTIDVSNCQPAAAQGEEAKTIGVKWMGGNLLADTKNGYLANSSVINGAKNIQFALSIKPDAALTGNIIIPGNGDQPTVTPEPIVANDKSAVSRFTYYVGYVTSTPVDVSAGQVQSYATYQISYE